VNGDQSLEAIVVLGNQMDAASGYCGEADFSLGTCVFNGSGNQILCFREQENRNDGEPTGPPPDGGLDRGM
jgi:hypothetical protein